MGASGGELDRGALGDPGLTGNRPFVRNPQPQFGKDRLFCFVLWRLLFTIHAWLRGSIGSSGLLQPTLGPSHSRRDRQVPSLCLGVKSVFESLLNCLECKSPLKLFLNLILC